MPKYDLSGARAAGVSDDDILTHLSSTRPSYDLKGALKSGVSKKDIISYLADLDPEKPPLTEDDIKAYGKVPGLPADNPYQTPGRAKPALVPGLNAPKDSGWRNPLEAAKVLADTTLIEGPSNLYGGARQLFERPKHPEDRVSILGASVPRERVQGAARTLAGVGETLTPLMPIGGAAALGSRAVAAEMAAGLAAPHLVGAGMEAAGADPDVTEATTNLVGMLPVGTAMKAAGRMVKNGGFGNVANSAMQQAFAPPAPAPGGMSAGPVVTTAPAPAPGLLGKAKLAMESAKTSIPFRTQENLRSLEGERTPPIPGKTPEDPPTPSKDLQQAVRTAAPSVARTKAGFLIQEDMPKINEHLRTTGVPNPEQLLPAALTDARLEAIQQNHQGIAAQYRQTPIRDIALKRSKLEEHVEFLDGEYPDMKIAKKLADINGETGGNDGNFLGWIDDNFVPKGGLLYRKGQKTGISPARAREMWDAEVQSVAPGLAKDMYHLQEAGHAPNPGGDVLFMATDAAGKAIRARDLMSRTHEGLAQSIFRNRHRQRGVDDAGMPRWINRLEEEFGLTPDEIAELPGFQEALKIYKRPGGIEAAMRGSHLERGGQETILGRHNTYYPLIQPQEEGLAGLASRFTERTKRVLNQRNPNQYATGLLNEYSRKVEDLTKAVHSAILQGDTKIARDALVTRPDLFRKVGANEAIPEGWATVYSESGYPKWVDPVAKGQPRVRVDVPGSNWIAPKQLADELRVLWDRSPYDTAHSIPPQHIEALAKTIGQAGIMTNLYGPADNMLFAMRLLTVPLAQRPALPSGIQSMAPVVGAAAGAAAGGPIGGILGATLAPMAVAAARSGRRILAFDPNSPVVKHDLTQMIAEGAMHPRYGRIATAARAADTGVEAVRPVELNPRKPFDSAKSVAGRMLDEMDRLVYGRAGLDVRVRWDMWKAHKEAYPNARPAERARFVNEIANYNRELTSQIERTVQDRLPMLAPFFTTGYGAITGGIRAATGVHALASSVTPAERLASITRSQISSGLTGYLATWAMANKGLNGQYPWEDPEGAKVGAIKLPPDLVAKLAPVIGDAHGKPVYVDALKFPWMLADKGSKALGITGVLDEAMDQQRGRVRGATGLAEAVKNSVVPMNAHTTKLFLDGFVKGLVNTWTQPFTMGPISGATAGALGRTPHLQSLAPPNGPQFLSARPKPSDVPPGSRDLFDHIGNAMRPGSAAGEISAAALRAASGFFGIEGLPNAVGARESGFGNLDTRRVNPGLRTGIAAAEGLGFIPRQFVPYTGNPVGRQKRDAIDTKRLQREYLRNQ